MRTKVPESRYDDVDGQFLHEFDVHVQPFGQQPPPFAALQAKYPESHVADCNARALYSNNAFGQADIVDVKQTHRVA